MDYTPEELVGKNLYVLSHAQDSEKLRKAHSDCKYSYESNNQSIKQIQLLNSNTSFTVINKGQVLTYYYRIMNKNGGYTWLQTCATIVCNSKNADEQNIICVNYVISKREHTNIIMDTCQMEPIKIEELESVRLDHKSTDSPGNDPSDGGLSKGGSGTSHDSKLTSDSKGGDSRSHSKGGSQTNHQAPSTSTTTGATSLSADKDGDAQVTATTTARGRKRRIKVIDKDEPSDLSKIPAIESNAVNVLQVNSVPVLPESKTESSVKDLENAMSKHLPATTDFSTDTLLKQQQEKTNRDALQWIGHNTHFHQQAPMPASALLRQLYANRESVIRATTSRPGAGSFYSDSMQSTALPTPPGSESSYESQFNLQHSQKPSDAFTNLVSAYGSYPSAMEYQNAMTPPASVSPRDSSAKVHSTHNTNYEYGSYIDNGDSTLPPLPLKPQAYSAAAAAMHHGAIDGYSGIEQSQYFPHPTGFHLYHKGQGWYSTPT